MTFLEFSFSGLFFLFFLKISLLEMLIAFGNEHLKSTPQQCIQCCHLPQSIWGGVLFQTSKCNRVKISLNFFSAFLLLTFSNQVQLLSYFSAVFLNWQMFQILLPSQNVKHSLLPPSLCAVFFHPQVAFVKFAIAQLSPSF